MPKKNKAEDIKKDNAPLNGALKFFIGGCLAEIYLLVVRKYYINGDVNQMLAWDDCMPMLIYGGLAVLVLGVALAFIWKNAPGWKRSVAWAAIFAGAFFSAGNWLIRRVYPGGVSILCVVAAAVMILGVLWCLYARECFYALTILGTGIFATWVCRHGMNSINWKALVIAGACVYLAMLAVAALATRKMERTGGVIGTVRLLPANTDCTVLFATCGLSAAATLLSLFSATIAYYALWVLGIAIFILAVYYTVKEL